MNRKDHLVEIGTSLIVLIVLFCFSFALTSLCTVGTEQTKLYGGTLRIGLFAEPIDFLLGSHSHAESHGVGGKIIETLVTFDFNMSLKPKLAESWEISPDGLTYTFNLVRNATWHDGEPFTSADVKYSFEELHKQYNRGLKGMLASLVTVETPDLYTAVFRFSVPVPVFLQYCGDYYGFVYPKHLYEGTDPLSNEYNLKPVGTGPFVFVEWKRGEYITLKYNPNYYIKGEPYISNIIFKIIKDRAVMTMAFEMEEIDLVHTGFSIADLARLDEVPGVAVTKEGKEFIGRMITMFFNHNDDYIKDKKVRQALLHSIDREKMANMVYYDYATPSYSYFPSTIAWCYNEDASLENLYPFDLDQANQILDEAGYAKGTDGIRFVLEGTSRTDYVEEDKVMELWREDLLKVGIDFQYIRVEKGTFFTKMEALDYGAVSINPLSHGPVPAITMARWLHSSSIGKPYVSNALNYTNLRVDELFEIARTESDIEKSVEALYEIQEILADDIPYIPLVLYSPPTIYWEDEWGGIPEGPTEWYGQTWSTYWWKSGVELDAAGILKEIEENEAEFQSLRNWFYDVTEAEKQLVAAREALDAGDFRSALTLSTEAKDKVVPPYWLYATIAIVVVVSIVGIWLYIRKRKERKK